LDLLQFNEQLVNRIKGFAQESLEHRQISRRLRDLLPTRYHDLKYRYRGRLHSSAKAERAALIDASYKKHIEEFVEVNHIASQARIQYETHLMLLQARQTLRALNRR
jgi:hypothetical protein